MRLKGGDPFVFGRGAEEALALAMAGIPFEVVPGVSTAIAAPELAGIPVTHRGIASGFLVLSGHAVEALEASAGARSAEQRAAGRVDGPRGPGRARADADCAWLVAERPRRSSAARPRPMSGYGPAVAGLERSNRPTGIAGVVVIGEVVRVREALTGGSAVDAEQKR